jgi:ABC-type Fe3+-hydroxamate transport system substrate-binding protein
MLEIKDQMNRIIRLEKTPERIISLVPSQTELLHDLGCEEQVVGITKFCIHPDQWFRSKTRVGGTKTVDFDKIAVLKPDLIIANKEENTQEEVEALCEKYPVYISDITTFEDALEMIEDVGKIVNQPHKAQSITKNIRQDLKDLPKLKGKVLYFIWANPYMAVGENTFIGQVLKRLGFENALSDHTARYVELSANEIQQLDADFYFLSSEPFPFKEEHQIALEEIHPADTLFVDGEIFSWYGSRMLKMKLYFQKLAKELT